MKNPSIRLTLAIFLTVTICSSNTTAREFFGIIDYKPTPYTELADEPFFYSIGKTLRYGRSISESGPALFRGTFFGGDLRFVYDSPDHKKAAVVYDGNLYLVEATKPARLLLRDLDTNDASEFRQGDVFYKISTIQWDVESRSIYIARDKKQRHISEQGFSRDATLVRIDIDTPEKMIDVIQDFRSIEYFLLGSETICFNYAPGDGSVVWKCSHGDSIGLVKYKKGNQIVLENGITLKGRPFVSYYGDILESEIWLTNFGFSLISNSDHTIGFFSSNNCKKPIFKIQGGNNIKGHFVDGIGQRGCNVLPGGRYPFINVYHDNFTGQLLVDGLTGKYRELPAKTKIWRNLNSFNYRHFKFDIEAPRVLEFAPAYSLKSSQ